VCKRSLTKKSKEENEKNDNLGTTGRVGTQEKAKLKDFVISIEEEEKP